MVQSSVPDPLVKLRTDIQTAQNKMNTLQIGVRLTDIRDQLDDFETKTSMLPSRIAAVRTKGYVFGKNIENRAATMRSDWIALSLKVLEQTNLQSNRLDMDMRALESIMLQLTSRAANVGAAAPYLNQVNSGISTLESKVQSTQNTIRGMYDEFSAGLYKLSSELDHIEWMLAQYSTAKFPLLNTEAPVNAVKADLEITGKEGKGDPKGILYLTDKRLLFEQKEEIATKKILFITTEKEMVHKLLFEFPAVLVGKINVSKEGFFKNEDHIDLELLSGGPFTVVHFHLDGQDCNEWQSQINKVKSKEFDLDRVVAVSEKELEKVKKAPSICPGCGGGINKPVLRGMDTITCDYCGYVIRI
jgi:hypothetical protein